MAQHWEARFCSCVAKFKLGYHRLCCKDIYGKNYDDAIFEGGENFTLKFTSATGDSTGGAATVTITTMKRANFNSRLQLLAGRKIACK